MEFNNTNLRILSSSLFHASVTSVVDSVSLYRRGLLCGKKASTEVEASNYEV